MDRDAIFNIEPARDFRSPSIRSNGDDGARSIFDHDLGDRTLDQMAEHARSLQGRRIVEQAHDGATRCLNGRDDDFRVAAGANHDESGTAHACLVPVNLGIET